MQKILLNVKISRIHIYRIDDYNLLVVISAVYQNTLLKLIGDNDVALSLVDQCQIQEIINIELDLYAIQLNEMDIDEQSLFIINNFIYYKSNVGIHASSLN